jgi:hypothetical protein
MKTLTQITVGLFFMASIVAAPALLVSPASAGTVSGHFRSNGTYVMPYQRSAPDGNPYNNYGGF